MRSLQIEGHPTSINSLHAALVAAATAHIDEVHRAQCTPETQVMFARMDCHGVGEDINQAVRMFAVALAQRRQLVLLPPAPHTARDECKVPASLSLTAAKPWHWLAGQALPMESIFVLSSCHKELLRKQPHIMEAIAESGAGNATSTAVRLGATALAAAASSVVGDDDGLVSPTAVGRIASFYYLDHSTMAVFARGLGPDLDVGMVLQVRACVGGVISAEGYDRQEGKRGALGRRRCCKWEMEEAME
jgi:hypothetical protein